MSCKNSIKKQLTYGVALGAVALAPFAMPAHKALAQGDAGTASTTGSGTMGSDTTMQSMPTTGPVTGTVVRYYVDRSGYVSAMDVQTPDGIRMVRFAPGMAQRIVSTYPVGATIAADAPLYVTTTPMTGRGMTGISRMDVIGMGKTAPSGLMQPYMVSDLELLEAEPYVMAGAHLATVKGNLKNYVVNDAGEIVGLVLGRAEVSTKQPKTNSDSGSSMKTTKINGKVMMVLPDGTSMPVMKKKGKLVMQMADGTTIPITKNDDGSYAVPEGTTTNLTGVKMKMMAEDGTSMDMDTAEGKLMVMMPDGTSQNVKMKNNGSVTVKQMAMPEATTTSTTTSTTTDASTTSTTTDTSMGGGSEGGAMSMDGGINDDILVRVPREFRTISSNWTGSNRVTPLFKGARVEVTGYMEAPRYGVVSRYPTRVIANAIVVNGRSAGQLGFPTMSKAESASLLKLNLFGAQSDEEKQAAGMGYTTYDPSASMSTSGTMSNGSMNGNTGMTGTTGATGTTGGM